MDGYAVSGYIFYYMQSLKTDCVNYLHPSIALLGTSTYSAWGWTFGFSPGTNSRACSADRKRGISIVEKSICDSISRKQENLGQFLSASGCVHLNNHL
jgi:hypothetical protein